MEKNLLDYTKLAEALVAYGYKHQIDGRGPSCRECLRVAEGHAGLPQPVCQTIEDVLNIARGLIQST